MSKVRRLFNKRLQRYRPRLARTEVIAGRADGTVYVPGSNNQMIYVRRSRNSLPFAVWNKMAGVVAGQHVFIGDTEYEPRIVQVVDVPLLQGTNNAVAGSVPPHEHGPYSANPTYIADWQILPLLVRATTGLNVSVTAGYVVYQGAPVYVNATTVDLTTSIPVAGARYSLVRVSSTGVIDVQDGTPVASLADLVLTDVPVCDDNYVPLAFVRLYEGQTTLSKVIDAFDVRMLVWGGGLFAGAIDSPISWIFADAAARVAFVTVTSGDVGKVAWQQDDNSLWILTDDDPITWIPVSYQPATQVEQEAGILGNRFCVPEWNALRKIGSGWALGTGGNDRGAGAVDLQSTRALDTNVASGQGAVIIGRTGSMADGQDAVVIGTSSYSSAIGSISIGYGNWITSAGQYGLCIGSLNKTTGRAALAFGVNALADKDGQFAQCGGAIAVYGDAQTSVLDASKKTTNATPATLVLGTMGGITKMVLATESAWAFRILLVARNKNANENAAWEFTGLITNDAGTTALIGDVTKTIIAKVGGGSAAWEADVSADDANDCLALTVTGEASHTIMWNARVVLSETIA